MYNVRSHNPFHQSQPPSSVSSDSMTPTVHGRGSLGLRDSASITGRSASGTVSNATHTHNNNYNDDDDDDDGLDPATRTLIAELLYEDLQELNASRKGKARSGAPLTDAEYAIQVQSEQLESMLHEVNDAGIARGMQEALRVDQEVIGQILLSEKVAQQDREFAMALNRGEALPGATREQMAMEGRAMREDAALSDMWQTLSPNFKPAQSLSSDKGKGKEIHWAPSPPPYSLSPPAYRPPVVRPECISCGDKAPPGRTYLKTPCDHHYCADCVTNLVNAATTDESLFPVRCCRKNIPVESLTRFISRSLLTIFQTKGKEFSTPANARVYCSISTCSAFLGNAEEAKRQTSGGIWGFSFGNLPTNLNCDKCRVQTCIDCRQPAHPNGPCKHNKAAQEVKDLARAQGWQTCPACERIIELSVGCNHMTCYCGYEFCYECAAKWKTCGCEQWEERRLYATAEARLEREYGERARVEQPNQWQREVQAFAQNLRVNHDCYPAHRWKGQGPGVCEECGDYMRVFLRMCRDCRLTVCRRCSLNRL